MKKFPPRRLGYPHSNFSLCGLYLVAEDIQRQKWSHQISSRTGETTFVFECPQRQDTIRTAKNCYEDIPIGEEGTSSFVTPVTRVYTTHSKKKPCNVKFPSTVKAVKSWLEMRPDPTPVSAPAKPSDTYNDDEHHMD